MRFYKTLCDATALSQPKQKQIDKSVRLRRVIEEHSLRLRNFLYNFSSSKSFPASLIFTFFNQLNLQIWIVPHFDLFRNAFVHTKTSFQRIVIQ